MGIGRIQAIHLEGEKDVKLIISGIPDINPLACAVATGNINGCKILLKSGASMQPNPSSTLLHFAAEYDQPSTAKILLAYNININSTDSLNRSSLHLAVSNNNIKFTKFIYNEGIDISILDNDGKNASTPCFLRKISTDV